MQGLYVHNILKITGGALFGDRSFLNKEISCADTDSRRISENGLFFAIKGERVDSHIFIEELMNDGRVICAVGENEVDSVFSDASKINGVYIRVADVYLALRQIAAFYRELVGIKIVGVTGSVGKTGTKEMIAAVLAAKYNVHKTTGNYNNEIGVPLTIFGIKKEHDIAVIEMGISDFLEMGRLSYMVKPDIMVITNIGSCHLEKLGDRWGVLRAKTESLDYISPDGKIILNADDDMLSTVTNTSVVNSNNAIVTINPEFYGILNKDRAFIYAEDIVINDAGTLGFNLIYDNQKYKVNLSLIGEHNVYNAMAAALVGLECDIDMATIADSLSSVAALAGRANMLALKNNVRLIDDCYNANPESMKAALKSLSVMKCDSNKKLAIIGDMLELGKESTLRHREIGEFIINNTDIKRVIFIGEHMKEAFLTVEKSDIISFSFNSVDDLTGSINEYISDGDVVLLKASHSMSFALLKDKLLNILK